MNVDEAKLQALSTQMLVKKKELPTHLGGLEPPTFWLTAKRANPLRHRCWT